MFRETEMSAWDEALEDPSGDTRPPHAHVLLALRSLLHIKQRDFAGQVGLLAKDLSRIEQGHRTLERRELDDLVLALGFRPEVVDRTLTWRQEVMRCRVGAPSPEETAEERAATTLGREATGSFRRLLAEERRELIHRHAHRRAAVRWRRFQGRPPGEQAWLVAGTRSHQEWAFCVKLCEESARAAAGDATRALDLAELALTAAERAAGDEAWRSRLKGYAWLFLANARRVKGDLPGSDLAFDTSKVLWEAGADLEGRLDVSRRYSLEASLRIKQDRFTEAACLLDKAARLAHPSAVGPLLIQKANLQEDLGDYATALATLYEARGCLHADQDPQNWLVLHFNLAVNLWHLERFEAARALLPQLRALAAELGAGLRLVRVLWLEGRIAAGLGEREMAVRVLEQVRQALGARQIAYDAALVTLELAVLYLEEGRTAEVQRVARELAWVFARQGIEQETKNAAWLFCQAVKHERATVELVRGLAKTLEGIRKPRR
jgi:tetratricopeptide (TPR) repeat protein/transcriptional regulator with XRE-family HTH domain